MLSFKKGQQMQLSCRCPKVSTAKKKLDGSRSCREAIREIETFSMDRGAIENLSRLRLKEVEGLDR